jgi:hypothetical protein
MKNYFTKIIAVILLLAFLPLTSAVCSQALFEAVGGVSVAQAAIPDQAVMHNNHDCGAEHNMSAQRSLTPMSQHNSLLPCCVDGSHTDIQLISQVIEPVKILPFISSLFYQAPLKNTIKSFIYHSPITSPPELTSVQATILRL